MKHTYISLGGACDVAMNMNALGMRKKSYPFDWLWNLDTGLKSVTDIISQNFNPIIGDNVYKYSIHYRFPNEMLVYSKFPSIVHLHTNPLNEIREHNKFCRRASNLMEELNSNNFKHFVYYRVFDEDILRNDTLSYRESFEKLVDEGKAFVDMFYDKYPNSIGKISMLLIMQVEQKGYSEVNKFINQFKLNKLHDKYSFLRFGCTFTRNDKNLYLKVLWQMQWVNLLINHTEIPYILRFKALCHYIYTSSYKMLKN